MTRSAPWLPCKPNLAARLARFRLVQDFFPSTAKKCSLDWETLKGLCEPQSAGRAGWFRSSMISRSIIGFGWKREPSHLELSPSKWGALNFQLRSRKKPSRFPPQLKPGCWRLFQRRIVLFQTCLDELAP